MSICANRISIIGGSGTGKTTLSNNIGKELNLPVYHIDGINYHANWVQRDKEERDKIVLDKINEDRWIIDGTYSSTLEERLLKSDLIIYLDYSTFSQIKGIMGRYFKSGKKERPEIPGCKEQMNFSFFIWVLKWRNNKRQRIIDLIKKNDIEKKLLIFKNRRSLNKWYKKEFEKNIII